MSHAFSVISNGGWKNSGTSGRALLTNMSSFLKSVLTRWNIAVTDFLAEELYETGVVALILRAGLRQR